MNTPKNRPRIITEAIAKLPPQSRQQAYSLRNMRSFSLLRKYQEEMLAASLPPLRRSDCEPPASWPAATAATCPTTRTKWHEDLIQEEKKYPDM